MNTWILLAVGWALIVYQCICLFKIFLGTDSPNQRRFAIIGPILIAPIMILSIVM